MRVDFPFSIFHLRFSAARSVLSVGLVLFHTPGLAQEPPPSVEPQGKVGAAGAAPQPTIPPLENPLDPQGPPAVTPPTQAPGQETGQIESGEVELFGESEIRGRQVKITVGEYTLSGDRLTGDLNGELVFSDGATLTYRGQTITGDTIRFNTRTRQYRVEHLRSGLSPEFLKGRLTSPLYLRGGALFGARRGPIFGEDVDATTCELEEPHYVFRAAGVEVEPGRRAILKKVQVILWGKRLFTLPTLVIPLNQRPRHTGYTPQVGRSVDEGWFVKSAFNYLAGSRTPGIFRTDAMEKKGLGIGVEQGYQLAKIAGLVALYGIPTGGFNNLSGRLNNRFNVGAGQNLSLDTDFQRNSYLALPQTTNWNTRMAYSRQAGGNNTTVNLSRMLTESAGFSNRSITAALSQALQFNLKTNANFNADYTSYASGGGTGPGSTTQQLSTRLQADQRAENYTLQLAANKNIAMGSTGQSFFGGVERFPELSLNNYRFTRGFLSRVPANFMMSVGRYSEGGFGAQPGGSTNVGTERAVVGFNLTGSRYALSPKTDLNVGGGFEQYFYAPGWAQYVLRNNTSLTQRWGRRSGINVNYTYQRPEGGTPFRFDVLGNYHTMNVDVGQLDDRRFQITARAGYDFAQQSFGGIAPRPWQTLSINTLWRPVDWARMRNLVSYDPNDGRMLSVTSDLRFRGRNEFALDLVTRYDPQRHKFGNINGFLNLPIGRLWRVMALAQYNGYLSRFESRSFQIIRDLHCMEATFSYVDNPFGFRQDRQFFFQLRIKGLPIFNQVGTGQFGQALDTGVGEIF